MTNSLWQTFNINLLHCEVTNLQHHGKLQLQLQHSAVQPPNNLQEQRGHEENRLCSQARVWRNKNKSSNKHGLERVQEGRKNLEWCDERVPEATFSMRLDPAWMSLGVEAVKIVICLQHECPIRLGDSKEIPQIQN